MIRAHFPHHDCSIQTHIKCPWPTAPRAAIVISKSTIRNNIQCASSSSISSTTSSSSGSSSSSSSSSSAGSSRPATRSASESLYSVRREMGASLLQIMADRSGTSESQVEAVAALVHRVQQLLITSPDSRQFRQVAGGAAAEYHKGSRPFTSQSTANTTSLASASQAATGSATAAIVPAAADATAAATTTQASEHTWVWEEVQNVVVLGLGCFGVYSSPLATGKQTVSESSRAAYRLYQLALALSLPSLLQSDVLPINQSSIPQSAMSHSLLPSSFSQSTASSESPLAVAALVAVQHSPADSPAIASVRFYDPAFDAFDLSLLMHLGCEAATSTQSLHPPQTSTTPACIDTSQPLRTVSSPDRANLQSTVSPETRWVVHQPTLFYMPCCPRDLYAAVIAQNKAAGTLCNVAILGNSLRSLTDSNQLLQMLTSFGQAPSGTLQSFMQPPSQSLRPNAPFASMSLSGSAPATGNTGGWGGRADVVQAAAAFAAGNTQMGVTGLGRSGAQQAAGVGIKASGQAQAKPPVQGGGMEDPEAVMAALLATKGAVVEVFAPDFSAHGVAVGLHLFPSISGAA